jgi:hypothetical protein
MSNLSSGEVCTLKKQPVASLEPINQWLRTGTKFESGELKTRLEARVVLEFQMTDKPLLTREVRNLME